VTVAPPSLKNFVKGIHTHQLTWLLCPSGSLVVLLVEHISLSLVCRFLKRNISNYDNLLGSGQILFMVGWGLVTELPIQFAPYTAGMLLLVSFLHSFYCFWCVRPKHVSLPFITTISKTIDCCHFQIFCWLFWLLREVKILLHHDKIRHTWMYL
jgi:hypothetical protein